MDISAASTYKTLSLQAEHAVKINKMVNDQIEAQGQMAIELIPDAPAPLQADPTQAVGQIVDIKA